MPDTLTYDVAVIGGGLAGLALAIQLGRQNYKVVLFEKEVYPFHKVCGEYVSMESWNFLVGLGIPLHEMQLPIIKKLEVSAPDGNLLKADLPLGGFGISRHLLDNELKKKALASGVVLHEGCKVQDIIFENDHFNIIAPGFSIESTLCCGSFGKRSNLDFRMQRAFIRRINGSLNNYIGVKYHIAADLAADTIALHNFEAGYCGVSKIEDGRYCVCYLTTADNLKKHHHSLPAMEQAVLYKNEHLKRLFDRCTILYAAPLTISQISFSKKTQVENHVLLLGDAAGLITPLCGNGMSMALHSSKIAAEGIQSFLQGRVSRVQLESNYTTNWQHTFETRIRTGRWIQSLFGKSTVTNIFIRMMKRLPRLTTKLIRLTHGVPF